MMMFSEVAFSIELIALVGGVGLLVWAKRNDGPGTDLASFVGYAVTVLSVLTVIFTISTAIYGALEMQDMMKTGCPMCNKMQDKSMMQGQGNSAAKAPANTPENLE